MNLFRITEELRRFRYGKLAPIALIVVILLPLIFGGAFVWSYWDPISGLKNMPVAVVNSDTGAEINGVHTVVGDEILNSLEDTEEIDFIPTDAAAARAGVADGTYYFALEIPADFSATVASAGTPHPQEATIHTNFNNVNGFLATMLGTQATIRVINKIENTVGAQIVDKLLIGIIEIGPALSQAGDGARRVADGAQTAQTGAHALATGSGQLQSGAQQLSSGASQLADGASRLDSGLGTAQQGARELATGTGQLAQATDELGAGARQIADAVEAVVEQLGALAPAQLAQLADGTEQLAYQLGDNSSPYKSGMRTAADGAAQLASGLDQLKDGSAQVVVGSRQVADGASQLNSGTNELVVGARALDDGLVTLANGSNELAVKITDGAGRIPSFTGDTRSAAEVISQPVGQTDDGQQVTNFGVGLSPFFISLGLYMGGMVMFMILRPLPRRLIDSGMAVWRLVVSSYITGLLVGLAQATVMWCVLNGILHLHPAHPVGMFAVMVAISATFVALTLAINSLFGPTVGRVIVLLFMAAQLVSSGGLYPVETQARLLRWFHPVDPMTYTVNLLRQQIIGTDYALDNRFALSAFFLLLVWLGSLIIVGYSAWRNRIVTAKTLHPELAL
ncbi:MAG: YhgE/Pip domain-containing protein [Corynebacterium sp.]|nr:YhgE/Pip domain-containing protein [Corynebacterium sp.]